MAKWPLTLFTKKQSKRADGMSLVRTCSQGVIPADDAAVPFHLASQDCAGTDLMSADGKPVIASGYCDAVDKDGDVWWLSWRNDASGNEGTSLGARENMRA